MSVDLGNEISSPNNGTCHELGKERDEEEIVNPSPEGLYPSTVDINDIAHGLEGEEGNTDREKNVEVQ